MTRILLQAFKNKDAQFSKIVVTDINREVADNLKKVYPEIQIGNSSEAASQDIVFISLHPPVVMDALEIIKENIKDNSILISLAPKISISKISSKLNHVKNIARLIPNATSYINEGYNPVSFSPDFDSKEEQKILDLLRVMGNTFEVREEKLESYAIMSAMLPTYFWFQWKELLEIGNQIGLNENESKDSIQETIIAALNLMFKHDLSPDKVMDLIPVKPIGEYETQISEMYRTKLTALFEKIKSN